MGQVIRLTEQEIHRIVECVCRMLRENRSDGLIEESQGFFDGCRELAIEIFDKIDENWRGRDNLTQRDYLVIPCEWASRGRIVILPTNMNVRAGYVYARYQVNGDTVVCINPIVIHEDESTFLPTLEHELTHAYEDSMRLRKGSSMYDAAKKNGYQKLFNYKFRGMSMEKDTVMKKDLANVLYWFTSFEQNAFFAGMFGRLIHGYEEPEDANECLAILQGTREYNGFANAIYTAREILMKKTEPKTQMDLVAYASELTNMKFTSYNQLCKWLDHKANKLERKMNVMVRKMVNRYFEMIENDEI